MGQELVTTLVIDSDVRGADPYIQGMGRAEDATKKTVDSGKEAALAIAGVGAAFVGIIAGVSTGLDYIGKANKQLADLQTLAKQVDLSLAGLQGVQFAGAIAGVDPEKLNAGLQKSASLLNDAQRNANSLSKEFAANGLKITDDNGKLISQNQLLGIAGDLIRRARTPQDQNAIAEMLGFSKELVPVLEQIKGGVEGLTAEARAAGAVIDDATIERATEFDKQWRKSSVEFSSYMKAALLGLLPYADDLIERLSRFIQSIDTAKIRAAAEAHAKEAGQAMDSLGIPREGGIRIAMAPETERALKDFNDESKSVWERIVAATNILSSALTRTDLQIIPQQDLKWEHGTSDGVTDTSNATITAGIRAEKNKAAWLAEGNAWKTLADDIVSGADKMVRGFSKVAAKDVANDQYDRAVITVKRHTDQLYAEADALGLGAGALAKFKTEAQLTSAAEAAGLPLTAARIAQIKELGLDAQDAANDLAKLKVASQIDFARRTAFLSQEDVAIARQLSDVYGNDVSKALASSEAQAIRLNNSLKQVNDIAGTAASSIAKDIANGVAPMEAFANAAKRAAESVLDIATKKIVSNALGGLLGDTAAQATGATTAAGILTSAGATVAASIVAGATEAASILGLSVPTAAATLPTAGAVTGGEVGAGGVVAGAALAEGGAVVETAAFTLSAAMGPIAIAMAAIAAIAAIIGLSGGQSKADKWLQGQIEGMNQRSADYANRAAMVGVDSNTRQGAILAQDQKFVQERLAENKAGGQQMNQLLQLQVQERNALLADWDKRDTDLLKQNADAKLALEKAAADRSLGFQNRLFAATNDFSTLQGQLTAFDRTAQQERLTEAQNGNQAIVDLEAAQAAERFNVIKSFNDKATADTQAAAKAQQDALNGTAKNLVEFVNGLYAGPSSTSSPIARRDAAGSTYSSQFALAQTNDPTALGRITSDAQNLIDAERAVSASSVAFQNLRDTVASQLLSLPPVQNTTDPSVQVMRDVLAAITAGNLSQAKDATLNTLAKDATLGTLSKDATLGTLLTASQLQTFGLSKDATVGSLLTNAQLAALGLSKDSTVGTLLTKTQLDTIGIATSASVGNLLTAAQLAEQGLATNAVTSGLLTQAQVLALGLSKDSTSGALLTSAQISALGLATDTRVGTLLTSAQLAAAHLAADTTVATLLTQAQLSQQGLAKDVNASAAARNTGDAAFNTGQTTGFLVNGIAPLANLNNRIGESGNTFLTSMNTFSDRIIQALNEQGNMQAGNYSKMILNSAILLNWMPKLVTTGKESAGGDGGGVSSAVPYTSHAMGGVIPAGGLGLVSEHLNPTWVRAGAEPITVSPFSAMSGNDNFRPVNIAAPMVRGGGHADMVAELRANREELKAMRAELAAFRTENGVNTMNAAGNVCDEVKATTGAVKAQTDTLASSQRQSDRQRKVA